MSKLETKKSGTSSADVKKSSTRVYILVAIVSCLAYTALAGYRQKTDDPYSYILPNALLFLGFAFEPLTIFAWRQLAVWDKSKGKIEIEPIAEMDASEYSYDKLRELTDDFLKPAVVRGLFDGVPAQSLWPQPGYLSSVEPLNKMLIPVVKNSTYRTWDYNGDRPRITFEEAYEELLANEDSVHYLFFPKELGGAIDDLRAATQKVIRQDLELDRIFDGYGSEVPHVHTAYQGSQIIAGRGKNNMDGTTGSDWHCAAGNNWFVQVVGRKRWFFMNPKYGAYMHPILNSWLSIRTSLSPEMLDALDGWVPMNYVDLSPGDLLYNPDFYWHTVKNYGGLTIGVPLREFLIQKCFESNFQYSSIAVMNNLLMRFYQFLG